MINWFMGDIVGGEFWGEFTEHIETFSIWFESSGFNAVTTIIVSQFAMLALLMGYAFILRYRNYRRTIYLSRLHTKWQKGLSLLLMNEMSPEVFAKDVPKKELDAFGEFLRPYLLDIVGEEKERLINLLYVLHFDQYLVKLLNGRQDWRRAFAAHFIGLIGHKQSIPDLREMLSDKSDFVVYTAAESLMQMQDSEAIWIIFEQLEGRAKYNQERMAKILFEYGPAVLPSLLEVLRKEALEPWVVNILFEVFRYHHFSDAAPVILGVVMGSEDQEVKVAGLRALSGFEDPSLAHLFHDLLLDGDAIVRATSAKALGSIGSNEHIPRLIARLFENEFWVVKNSIDALVEIGENGVEALCSEIFRGDLPPLATKLMGEAVFDGRFEV